MSIKPLKAYGEGGPNPPKVIMILKELGLPFEIVEIGFNDVKKPEYTAINPNGRLPALYDPNTDLTIWESGAIVQYLVETYDKNHKISYPKGTNESFLTQQWLFFQVSGQGPYYGQAIVFSRYHTEKVPSAVDRYIKEANRVTGVLESVLSKKEAGSNGPWLVGDKCTYADISFVMWQVSIVRSFSDRETVIDYANYPTVKTWLDKLLARPAVKEAIDIATAAYAKHVAATQNK
ncbi:glutathione S-transferase [Xylariaceae sp. FL0255]|nr:glutathione S-transferase [Xylariaceae sp. FL0255]